MREVSLGQAKARLSRLVDEAARGDPFVIVRAGQPLLKVTALDSPGARKPLRLGFMRAQMLVPDDFDRMGAQEIQDSFGASGE